MNNLHNIERLVRVIENSVFMTTGKLDYPRITDAIIKLSDLVNDYDGDSDDLWNIDTNCISIADLIVGAYWHFLEWHSGQVSIGYRAFCALDRIYTPNMEQPDTENELFIELDSMADNYWRNQAGGDVCR